MILPYLFCLVVLLKYVKTEKGCSCRDTDVDKTWIGPILKQTEISSLKRDECIGVTKKFPNYYLSPLEVNLVKTKKSHCVKKEDIKVFEAVSNTLFSGKRQVLYLMCEAGSAYHISVLEYRKNEKDISYLKRCESEYVSEDGTIVYVNTNLKNVNTNNNNNVNMKGVKVTVVSNAKTLYNNGYLYYICYNLVLILCMNFI